MRLIFNNSKIIFRKESIRVKTYGNNDCTIDGNGINATTGALSSGFPAWKASNFYEIDGEKVKEFLLNYSSYASSFGIAFYSSNNESTFISGHTYAYGDDNKDIVVAVPKTAKFLRFCTSNTEVLSITIKEVIQ